MMNFNLQNFALTMLSKNPQIANNPNAQEMIAAIQNGDSKKGEEIASNLCNTYGVTREEGVKMAKSFFGI